ncbi:MAG: tRNA lysidine(34) synthetase TilS [Paludibacteraceae bacterium]|nr:tRNA lysidine(34) synthetase TilS [Paludibacteraceae bacterium]
MQKQIEIFIGQNELLSPGQRVLVALSGGADSVVLLRILLALGYDCAAAHCNFHLRGEESMRDERFVRSLCQEVGIVLHTIDFDTEHVASEKGISIEMAARELRYQWFEELRQMHGYDAIAVAHHQNDQAETLLLNLARGTGLRGLGGMHPKNGYIVRPLLCVTRENIEEYAAKKGWSYVIDSTNADTKIRRNGYRSLLQAASQSDIRHFAETARLMQGYQQLIDCLIQGKPIEGLAEDILMYELLSPYGFTPTQIHDMLIGLNGSGKRFEASQYVATIDHGQLTISNKKETEEVLPTLIRSVRPRMSKEHFAPAKAMYASFDADVLGETLHLRHWRAGDYFYPISSGHAGKKKLQDFFSDQKLSVNEKAKVWLLCTGEGEDEQIVWIIGHRIDNRYKVTEQTKRVADIEIEI